MKKTDSDIQQAVLRELKWDMRVEETDVGVEVDSGVVTLSGTVSSWAKKMAAQEAAHKVAGVLDVANDITVKVPGIGARTDTEIAAAVRRALEWDVFVPEERIRSTVSGGWVTLEGDVDYWVQRNDAERAVRNLSGVRAVSNKIEVKPSKVITFDLRAAIEDALERRAEREARRIDLEVHDGRVSLKGTVHTWAEKQAVIGAVKGTPGVQNVEDHLRIQPQADRLMTRTKNRSKASNPKKEARKMRSLVPWRSGSASQSSWEPFKELEQWHRGIDDLFSRFTGSAAFEGTAFAGEGKPAIESLMKNGDLVVRADLPGVDPKEVDISVTGNVLTVKGERKHKEEKKEGEYTREEIAYGSFERSIRLPEGVDAEKIRASYDKGVLEITMPAPKGLASKKVPVQIEAKK